jgi:hypothetical protein
MRYPAVNSFKFPRFNDDFNFVHEVVHEGDLILRVLNSIVAILFGGVYLVLWLFELVL